VFTPHRQLTRLAEAAAARRLEAPINAGPETSGFDQVGFLTRREAKRCGRRCRRDGGAAQREERCDGGAGVVLIDQALGKARCAPRGKEIPVHPGFVRASFSLARGAIAASS